MKEERGLPFPGFTEEERKRIKYVISDVDDTITRNGRLLPQVLAALYSVKISGRSIILVTGGSVGWADCYIRQWPVDAVVAESGAVLLCHDRDGGITNIINPSIDKDSVLKKRLELMGYTSPYPFSSDQTARVFDIAYDKAKMTPSEINVLKNILTASGASYAESSIHINAWFGSYDEKSALKYFMVNALDITEDDLLDKSIYLGDSFNDQPLFEYIPMSIGMHTVEERREEYTVLPKYITEGTSGEGWIETATSLTEKDSEEGSEK